MSIPKRAQAAHLARAAAREHSIEIERVRPVLNKPGKRVFLFQPPVRDQPEAGALPCGRMSELSVARPPKEGNRLRANESRVDEIRKAELAGSHMPFALQVLAKDGLAHVILRRALSGILDQHVIERPRSLFEGDAADRRSVVKELRGVEPK